MVRIVQTEYTTRRRRYDPRVWSPGTSVAVGVLLIILLIMIAAIALGNNADRNQAPVQDPAEQPAARG